MNGGTHEVHEEVNEIYILRMELTDWSLMIVMVQAFDRQQINVIVPDEWLLGEKTKRSSTVLDLPLLSFLAFNLSRRLRGVVLA